MAPKSKSRSLPKGKNPLIQPADDHAALVKRCKVQNVVFDAGFSVNVIRLKVPIPKSQGSDEVGGPRFITRMKDTDFFQALSMFECAFPFATEKEKEAEKQYIEKRFHPMNHDDVRGVWITSEAAQQLAEDYNLSEHVSALIDAAPDTPNDSLIASVANTGSFSTKKNSETPASEVKADIELAAPVRRSRRSTSPTKKTSARATTPRASKAPSSTSGRGRKKKTATSSVADDESVASTSSPLIPEATIIKAEEALDKVIEEGPPVLDTIQVRENDSAALLAAAAAQVEAAKAEEESAPPTTRVKRALEIDEQEATPREEVPVKRARVDELEREVWVDGRRGRALLGLAIGLGASVILPYLV